MNNIPDFKQVAQQQRQLLIRLEKIRNTEMFTDNCLELLVGLVQKIRPNLHWNYEEAQEQLLFLITVLRAEPRTLNKFQQLLSYVFIRSDISEVLTESGVQSGYSFFYELNKRIRHKILPQLKNKGSFLYAINAIFYKRDDYKWIERVDNSIWLDLFELMGLEVNVSNKNMLQQLSKSLLITSSRISSLGVEPDVQRCLNETQLFSFINQNEIAQRLVKMRKEIVDRKAYFELEEQLVAALDLCESVIHYIQAGISELGTSLHQNYILMRLKKLTDRMRMALDILNNDGKIDMDRVVRHFEEIVKNENTKNSIRMLMRENIELLAYRIAEHERNTGELYITKTRAEYYKMLKSAVSGGVIISFIAIIKSLLTYLKMAPFWQSFAYSVNYTVGFFAIYTSGSTLATKQPAMTASAIASSLDSKKNNSPNLAELAILVSEVVRSQTASFVGNLTAVFPLTLCIAFLWNLIFGFSIVEGDAAQAMLDAQNPLKSLSLLYACFTGVFLYLSGIISGYFDNLSVYGNIPQRLREHPGLKRTFAQSRIDKIADYTGKHLGGLMGNLSLGFFLGMAGFMGYIFGVNFDIRHITISTANFAIGLQGLGFNVSLVDFLLTGIGVLLIGFINFLVSFALAFFTALASRKIRFRQYKRFGLYLVRLFVRFPLDFIRPPESPRKPGDFIRHRNFVQK